jgi:hypothetical protein
MVLPLLDCRRGWDGFSVPLFSNLDLPIMDV